MFSDDSKEKTIGMSLHENFEEKEENCKEKESTMEETHPTKHGD